jgi:SAM-dependent methyltransferase
MKDRAELQRALAETIRAYGEWVFDIRLPHGLRTRTDPEYPHTRLRRILQIIGDTVSRPLSECRVLDLGCLDGLYSVELALHGARVLGIEAREANYRRAVFVKEAYDLPNLQFIRDDVRHLSKERHGTFDIVLCSGILYHLPAPDVFHLLESVFDVADREVIIDTHVALESADSFEYGSATYHGLFHVEHRPTDDAAVIEARTLDSIDRNPSFQFTRPSLMNFLGKLGFSSVYECFNPPHLNFGMPGLEHRNRCTLLALKGVPCRVYNSPSAQGLEESWPEGSLTY